jgi:hypothetical protein
MKKAMISQPMAGKTEEEILAEKAKAVKVLKEKGYEIVNTYFGDDFDKPESLRNIGVQNIPLYFLAQSLAKMSTCDAVYFCKGWEFARGCLVEYRAAASYGLDIIHYDDECIDKARNLKGANID